MSKVREGSDPQELTVVARRVLLDALDALEGQAPALVLVGAQAVHLRTKRAALTGTTYTSDADLGVDPRQLEDEPLIEQAMTRAGFIYSDDPGIWKKTQTIAGQEVDVAVDLLVPERLVGGGKTRGARIPPHDKRATRKMPGLEPAAFDHSPLQVSSLEPDRDPRTHTINVAGHGALLLAKAFKIRDRLEAAAQGRTDRLTDKDAGDVIRLMMTSGDVTETLEQLEAEETITSLIAEGRGLLIDQFGVARAAGVDMAVRALAGDMPEERVRLLAPNYINTYLR